ncbi:hypothetical protein OG429_38640 [Streptomyces sp. NBC_00190]|uniref:hypothetical protein n=1 Tax=unclassified Streptomyces TaxID=2593676 RepID=UPI002E2E2C66|nr:hypothetical protein [Streptomyces sp. NBC_00190]WSZ44660.1 hypothetical protein OG239_41070 [Streptomyces sp. NBC_00868]
MAESDVVIGFAGVERAQANVLAAELREHLFDREPALAVEQVKDDGLTQDAGVILEVILGSTATSVLATGLAMWLRRRHEVRLTMKRRNRAGETVDVTLQGRPDARLEAVIKDFLQK